MEGRGSMNYGKFFSETEFACRHCQEVKMDQKFLNRLNELRGNCGFPFRVTSGYRCPDHPVEAKKGTKSGAHTTGKAVDIACDGALAYILVKEALAMEFKGIGVNQKGNARFIHLDDLESNTRPTIWSY
jgi:uncharacterized protein YcbK (DUF882 family)